MTHSAGAGVFQAECGAVVADGAVLRKVDPEFIASPWLAQHWRREHWRLLVGLILGRVGLIDGLGELARAKGMVVAVVEGRGDGEA